MAHRQERSPIVWIQENSRLGHRWHSLPAPPFISRGNSAVLGEIENILLRSLGSAWADADTTVMSVNAIAVFEMLWASIRSDVGRSKRDGWNC
jgi:hypothetical protein